MSYSDRETAEAVRCDVRWKVAIGLAPLDEGFDPSTLVYWRRRIARSERPHRVNEAVRKVIEADRVLKGRRRRAVDSTILVDAVATQDTSPSWSRRDPPGRRGRSRRGGEIAVVCTGHDYSGPGKPKIDWDDPAAKEALVSALVNDATRWWPRSPRRSWTSGRFGGGVAGAGGRPGRRAGRRLRRPGRAVADRPQGRRRPRDLHRGPGGPAHPQVPEATARTATGRTWSPNPRPGSSPMRS